MKQFAIVPHTFSLEMFPSKDEAAKAAKQEVSEGQFDRYYVVELVRVVEMQRTYAVSERDL